MYDRSENTSFKAATGNLIGRFLEENEATIEGDKVVIKTNRLALRKERGGGGKISGYKINPLFFVYKKDCTFADSIVYFNIKHIRQLNPTIAAKVFFNTLLYKSVKEYYTTC